jgi:hypothetical protein
VYSFAALGVYLVLSSVPSAAAFVTLTVGMYLW